MPIASLFITGLRKDEASSTFSTGWLIVKKIIGAWAFCANLVLAFKLVTWLIEDIAVRMHMSSFVPQMESFECLMMALLLLLIMEATQLSLYVSGHLLIQTRMGTIRILNYINRLQLRSLTGKQHSFPSRTSLEREPSVRGTTFPESTADAGGLMPMNDGDQQEDSNLIRRAVDGFWTLLNYSINPTVFICLAVHLAGTVDFPKFTQSLPIEKRTNPDGSIVEEMFENERLQPFRVKALLAF